MRIGLVDCDSHNFPNLPLMKISAYYKGLGQEVEFALKGNFYDKLYVSKIFTESKEPKLPEAKRIYRGGSGYNLENYLPYEVEHCYPDYGLYPSLTKNTAFGFLTRGCPRKNHSFCITPKKDGCVSRKTADLDEFWRGQKKIILLDQNILACKERMDLLEQLASSNSIVEFNGGMDIRYINNDVISMLRRIKVQDYHFAWDDPREDLREEFRLFRETGLMRKGRCGVYVLTNYWSTTHEDLFRVYMLLHLGYHPFIMIYDKQKFVDKNGRWLPGVAERYDIETLRHFKICQHMQRWCGRINIIKRCVNFSEYEPYRIWLEKGMPVPERTKN